MSLKDAIAADLLNIVLNTDDWAEVCAYQLAETDPSEAVTLTALIRDGQSREDGDWVDSDKERIQVLLCRDPNSTKGGVAQPRIGDCLTRTSIDDRPYAFMEFEKTDDPSCWRLIFQRQTQRMAGPGGQR